MAQDPWGVQSVEDNDQGGWGVAEIEEDPKKKKKDPWALASEVPALTIAAPAAPPPAAVHSTPLPIKPPTLAGEIVRGLPSFAKDVAQDTAKQVAAAAAYEGAGAVKGLTLGYVNPTKLLEKTPLANTGISKGAAAGAGEFIGAFAPISAISKAVGGASKMAQLSRYARPIYQALAEAAATGGTYGAVRKPEEGESRTHNALKDAAFFTAFVGGIEMVKRLFAKNILIPNAQKADIVKGAAEEATDVYIKEAGSPGAKEKAQRVFVEALDRKATEARAGKAQPQALQPKGFQEPATEVTIPTRFGSKVHEVLDRIRKPSVAPKNVPGVIETTAEGITDPWRVKVVEPAGEAVKPSSMDETPVQEAPMALGEKTAPPSTPQAPPVPLETQSGGQAQPRLFPEPKISSYSSVSQHPDFVKMTDDAQKIVEKYITKRNLEPTPDFAENLFGEMHDALGEILSAPKEKRIEVAKSLKERYPDLENEFITLKRKLYSDTSEGYFDRYVAGKYGDFRPKVAIEPPSPTITNAESFKQAWAKANPNVTPQQLDAISTGMLDARAATWSKMTGKPPEEWFKSRFAEIKKGTPEQAAGLSQEAGKPGAVFLGYQEMGHGAPPVPLYNVRGIPKTDPYWDSTVTGETLQQKGITIPTTPTFEEYNSFVQSLGASGRSNVNKSVIEKWGSPELLQEATPAPTFYSTLQRTLEQKMPNAASPEQIKGILAQGVKQEEIEWSGLDQFLEGKTKVSKQELLDFLKSNEVQVQEIEKVEVNPEAEEIRNNFIEQMSDKYGLDWSPNLAPQERAMLERLDRATDRSFNRGTKFQQYQLPGGENYRELLLTLPPTPPQPNVPRKLFVQKGRAGWFVEDHIDDDFVSGPFQSENEALNHLQKFKEASLTKKQTNDFVSSHFEEPNILAHVRFNDRTGPNGEKILFVEEVQSDWHQKGREAGYRGGSDEKLINDWLGKQKSDLNINTVSEYQLGKMGAPSEIIKAYIELSSGNKWGAMVPNAPFKKTWPELAMKRMLRYATENGYDKIAWTTGAQQADRYDLGRQISEIESSLTEDGRYIVTMKLKEGRIERVPELIDQDKLSDYVGKDLAKKIIDSPKQDNSFSGLDLKVGGEGMAGFYDQILPSFMNKYTKKWGGRVGTMNLTGQKFYKKDELLNALEKGDAESEENLSVHVLDITPAMKESVSRGQPLFQGPKGSVSFDAEQKAIISAFEKADASTVIHELGHVFRRDLYRTAEEALPEYRAQLEKDMATAEAWAGAEGGQWSRAAEEKWARGFENYITTGQAPNKALQRQFDMFSDWMRQVYGSVIGSAINVQVSPQVKEVFDRLFTPETARQTETQEIANQFKEEGSVPLFQEDEGTLYQMDELPGEDPRKTVKRIQERAKRDLKRVSLPSREKQPKRYTEAAALRRSLQRQAYAAAQAAAQVEKEMAYEARFKEAESKSILDWKVAETKAKGQENLAEAKARAKAAAENLQEIKKQIKMELDRLPLSERGRFISSIVNAKTPRAVIQTNARIDDALEKYQRRILIRSLHHQFNKFEASKAIDIDYIKKMRQVMNGVVFQKPRQETLTFLGKVQKFIDERKAAGENVKVPQYIMDKIRLLSSRPLADMPVVQIEDIFDQISTLAELGKTKLRALDEILSTQKQKDMNDLAYGTKAINSREIVYAKPGEELTLPQSVQNSITAALNASQGKGFAILPIDVIADMMDGNQGGLGPTSKIYKARADSDFNAYLNLKDKWEQQFKDVLKGKGLKKTNSDRIGVRAIDVQDTGREKLVNTGLSNQDIDAIKLTPAEQEVYQYMRKFLDFTRPLIAQHMKEVHNVELGYVEGYFPFRTDADKTSPDTIRDRMLREMTGLRKNPHASFAKERVGAGKQILDYNSFKVFLEHLDNVAYLLSMGRTVKYLGELASTDAYRQIAGNVGQQMILDWVDTVARKGGGLGDHQIKVLDFLRRNVGVVALGLRLVTTAIQLTTVLQGGALIGPYAFKGALNITLPRWRKFVLENMGEVRERDGGEPAFNEFLGESMRDKFARGVMLPIQVTDKLSAMSVASGAYEKYMRNHNLPMDFEKPNKDAIAFAQRVVRRTQGSGFPKDVPQAISRGKFSGNLSADKSIFQFNNFLLNDFSLITHEGLRQGVFKGNFRQGFNVLFFASLATLAIMGIRSGVNNVLGKEPAEKDKDKTLWQRFYRELLFKIPFVGQAYSMAVYHSSGIPALDVLMKTGAGFYRGFKSQNPPKNEKDRRSKAATRLKGRIDAAIGTAAILGFPIPSQLADLVKLQIDKHKKAPPAGSRPVKLRAAKTNTVKIRTGK